ncbi:MAG TPA: hypothetical protein VH105_17895 [Burkholderiales bacterium]|nr:hypothetical protein [Burkholderiales bacterium]
MKSALNACLLALLGLTFLTAHAADTLDLDRLATCQESWQAWKTDQARMSSMGQSLNADYARKDADDGPYFAPKGAKTLLGMPVVQLYPASVGMGVGFSVVVGSGFEAGRASVEKAVGKPLKQCESSDGMKSCELELGPQKTVVIMAADKGGTRKTLVGCMYYYAK